MSLTDNKYELCCVPKT